MADLENTPARPERKATLKLGQRELSRLSLAVVLLIVAGLAFGVYRVFLSFKSQRDITLARANLHAMHVAFSNYAQDWGERLPPADHWMEAVAGYLPSASNAPGGKTGVFQGPGDGGTVGYVYNELAAGYHLEPSAKDIREKTLHLDQLVLLVEKNDAPPNAHALIPSQDSRQGEDALYKTADFPHYAADPDKATTVLLFANGKVTTRTRLDFTAAGQNK